MITGIEHTAIATPDPAKLARWYVDHLGFVVNFQLPGSPAVFVKAPNGHMLEMIEAAAPLPGAPARSDPGLRHLAIQVDDFEAEHQRLQAAGVHFLSAPEKYHGNTVAFFTDCDGNILHLLHREKPLP